MTLTTNLRDASHELSPDGLYTLLRLFIPNAGGSPMYLYLSPREAVTVGGKAFQSHPFHITGLGFKASGELSRPQLTMANPEGQLMPLLREGAFDMARVTRYTVHPDDLAGMGNDPEPNPQSKPPSSPWANQLAITHEFYIAKTLSYNRQQVSFELRAYSDGPKAQLPARRFTREEGFKSVRI